MKYSIVIQWSDLDEAYIASLPEWGEFASTHGETYIDQVSKTRSLF